MTESGPAFVTGASGFIGRPLVKELARRGRKVIGLCRRPEDLAGIAGDVEALRGDLRDLESCAGPLRRATTVFHLAAVRAHSYRRPEDFAAVNVRATLDLARRVFDGVGKLVFVGTAHALGPSADDPLAEDDSVWAEAPAGGYVWSRIEVLRQMRLWSAEGRPLLTLLPTIVFGPDEPRHPNVVTNHMRGLLTHRLDVVVEGGQKRRDLVFVDDVVEGVLLAEERAAVGEEFILGGEDVSHRTMNDLVLATAGVKARWRVSLPRGLCAAGATVIDLLRQESSGLGLRPALAALGAEWRYTSAKARRELGYAPRTLQAGISETVRFIEGENP